MTREKALSPFLYLGGLGLLFVLLTLVGGVFGYVIYLGLQGIYLWLALGFAFVLFFCFFYHWLMYAFLMGAVYLQTSVSPTWLRRSHKTLIVFFPLLTALLALFGVQKRQVETSFIVMINRLVRGSLYKVPADKVLLLVPHCLQWQVCPHKVTVKSENCRHCGQCKIGDLIELAKAYGCHLEVVSGGTLARMLVKKLRPEAIVAIACERDLASGMSDVFPIPVLGVVNDRPYGPCCNTQVDINEVRQALERIIYG